MSAINIKLIGLVLLFAVFNSQALTLGRVRGVALVGQGLDVAIQVQVDPDESPASLCFEADVFHADTRQDSGRVQVTVEPTQTAQTFNVRVVSSSAIDEPVVTVYLRAGCAQKTSRRYVMLADVVSEQMASPLQRSVQVPLIAPVSGALSATAAESTATSSAPGASTAAAAGLAPGGAAPARPPAKPEPVVVRKPRPVTAAKPVPAVATARKAERPKAPPPATPSGPGTDKQMAGRAAGQSRLKLDPLEVLSERVATLETTTASAPAESAAREARDAQRLQSLEASVKSLLAMAARNEASLLEMQVRLREAESERFMNPLVYGLIALLLASLAGIGFLVSRRGRPMGASGGNWWSSSERPVHDDDSVAPTSGLTRPYGYSPVSGPGPLSRPGAMPDVHEETPEHEPVQHGVSGSRPVPITQVDVSLVEMSESTFDRLMQSGATHSAVRKPRSADAAEPTPESHRRSINSEELLDIRQQAEFFVSLGQTDQAVRILENRIGENGEASPLAYLDLLKIFHSLGLKADFRQVREDFSLLFNARVPEFSDFDDEGKELEAYPGVLAGITSVWGTPAVFAAIETCLFRDQWITERELFDLAAFRDLLLLHAVAQGAASAGGPNRPHSALSDAPLPKLDGVPDIDIDLSDLHGPASGSSVAPQVGGADIASPLLPHLGGLNAPLDPGNLIDFDLTVTPNGAAPKAAK